MSYNGTESDESSIRDQPSPGPLTPSSSSGDKYDRDNEENTTPGSPKPQNGLKTPSPRTSPRQELTPPKSTEKGSGTSTNSAQNSPTKTGLSGRHDKNNSATNQADSTDKSNAEKTGDGSKTKPALPNPDLNDMRNPHTWRGQRQPPVGARLLHLLNFLTDEDVDRRRDWARELDEAEAWVTEMLAERDERGFSDATIKLLNRAKEEIATHRKNEKWHYRTFMPLDIPDPANMPKYKPRLPWNGCEDPIEFGVSGPKCKKTKIMPSLPAVQRRTDAVNKLWNTEDEVQRFGVSFDARVTARERLAEHEDRLMTPLSEPLPGVTENLSVQESTVFELALKEDGGLMGWTHEEALEDNTTGRALYSGGSFFPIPNGSEGTNPLYYAAERGARRAGLQAALRSFHSNDHQPIANSGRMLVLPGGVRASVAEDLDQLRNKAGIGNERPIALPELPANQMQRIDGKTDPQGFTSNMSQYWRNSREGNERAHNFAMAEQFARSPDGPLYPSEEDRNKPLLPESCVGPFVWRGVPAYVHLRQDLLRKMEGLKRLFDHERTINSRGLLERMAVAFDRGHTRQPPRHVRLDTVRDIKPVGFTASPFPSEDDQRSEASQGEPLPNTFLLEKVEMEWIRFLLNNSVTKGMTVEALPRTTLFLIFAERLARIFNDPGDTLFPARDTSVSIEDLIAHMANMKGPVQKTTFYPYDVKMFLERLAHQGRCRYTEDWRTYGQVQRPLLNYFPEHLVIWQPRNDTDADAGRFVEDSIPHTPRFTDRRTWLDLVANDPPEMVDANVMRYFVCLAYKWGRSMQQLQESRNEWTRQELLPVPAAGPGLDSLNRGYLEYLNDQLKRSPKNSALRSFLAATGASNLKTGNKTKELLRLWRATTNAQPTAWPTGVDKGDKLAVQRTIQRHVIDEVVRADNMLYPGRTTDYTNLTAPKTRESIWDWARPAIRGEVKQFFSLNRWPVELQKPETQARIKDDVDVDPEVLWNPIVEDPTPWTYYRPKARPYGEDRVKFRSGQRMFPIGDTARQREVVKNQVMSMVGRGKPSPPPFLTNTVSWSLPSFQKVLFQCADRVTPPSSNGHCPRDRHKHLADPRCQAAVGAETASRGHRQPRRRPGRPRRRAQAQAAARGPVIVPATN